MQDSRTLFAGLIKTWDTLTLHNAIEDCKERITDGKLDRVHTNYYVRRIVTLMDEYARR